METVNLTSQQISQALAWINGQPSTLGEREMLELLRSLTSGYQENCRRLRPGPVPLFRNLRGKLHPLSLSGLTPEQEVMRQVAEESRIDSVLLINSIAHVGATAGYPVTQSRAQLILYCLYGSRLGAGKERLPIEHPQVWRYGPVFPRAYKRGALEDQAACEDSYMELIKSEPALATDLLAKTHSMMATPMADLNAVHKSAQSPYGKTKARYPEKWGVQIPDDEIAAFFRGTVPKKKA